MDEFNKIGLTIQEDTTEELRSKYMTMLKNHQKNLTQNILQIIQVQTKDIKDQNIDSLIEKHLITELNYNGMYTITKLYEDLVKTFKSVSQELNQSDKESLFKKYIDSIKQPIKTNQMDWLDKELEDFVREFIKGLENLFKEIPNNNFSQIKDKIYIELHNIMNKYKNKFIQDYNSLQKDFIIKNITQITKLINKTNLNDIRNSEFKKYYALIELSKHKLFEENEKFYAKNKETKEIFELQLKNGVVTSKKNELKYKIDSKKGIQGHWNTKTQKGFMIQSNGVTIVNFKERTSVRISKNNQKYKFFKNDQETNDIKEIEFIIEELKKTIPILHSKIIKDPCFDEIIKRLVAEDTSSMKR